MNTTTLARPSAPAAEPAAARLAFAQLARLRAGTLSLQLPDGNTRRFGAGELHAQLTVRHWRLFGRVLSSGDIGLAECYLAGDWDTPSLPDLLALLARNRAQLERALYGSWWGSLAHRVKHLLNRNSRGGSRRNIHAHYDLGNAFYALWLDPGMNYSAALFNAQGQSLAQAQDAKTRRALTAAGVQPGHRVLEIGCGWGALAEMAACEFGARVTGVTLSTEQLAYATRRLNRAGAAGRFELRLQDYREIGDAPFDAICSIEMVEAVGREYWPGYFASVARLLKPGGRACIQTIVMDDALWPRYIRGTDFIQQYIFPGGCLPCRAEFEGHARKAGLEVVDATAFGRDYATTLRHWRERFLAERSRVLQLGFDENFLRLWEFYLAYCEAAFGEGTTDVLQYTLRKPDPGAAR